MHGGDQGPARHHALEAAKLFRGNDDHLIMAMRGHMLRTLATHPADEFAAAGLGVLQDPSPVCPSATWVFRDRLAGIDVVNLLIVTRLVRGWTGFRCAGIRIRHWQRGSGRLRRARLPAQEHARDRPDSPQQTQSGRPLATHWHAGSAPQGGTPRQDAALAPWREDDGADALLGNSWPPARSIVWVRLLRSRPLHVSRRCLCVRKCLP